MQNLSLIILLMLSINTFAKQYVLVGISGFGTRRPKHEWQKSGAHELLPRTGNIFSRHELVHYAKTRELQEIIDEFDCEEGKQTRSDLGLIILANSWGSSNGYKLAKMYKKQCGRLTDAFYMVDGVSKPIGRFHKKIPSKICINAYQTKGLIGGTAIKGCQNYNLTKTCDDLGIGAIRCHIQTEWDGCRMMAKHMSRNYLN